MDGTHKTVEAADGVNASGTRQYWMYSPFDAWSACCQAGRMAIAWAFMGDLKQYPSRDDMNQRMVDEYIMNRNFSNQTLATWQFANGMAPGDVVYAKEGRRFLLGRGIVLSDYLYMPWLGAYPHVRRIRWTHIGRWLHPGQAVTKSLTRVLPGSDYIARLEAIFAQPA